MTETAITMIVRNEAPTIAATLRSAREILGPGPTIIHDTGSTDATVDVVCEALNAFPHVGNVVAARPFDDFSGARNAVLGHAREACPRDMWVLMLSAGCVLEGALDTRAMAKAQGATLEHHFGASLFDRVDLVRASAIGKPYAYVGTTHEVLTPVSGKEPRSGLSVHFTLKDLERESGRNWVRDLALLESDFSPRGRFYYAQTLELLGRKTQAVRAYIARYEMEAGFQEERVVAMIRCIAYARDWQEAESFARLALALNPTRGEAWVELCAWADDAKCWSTLYAYATRALQSVPKSGSLFVNIDRVWRAHLHAGDACSSRGDFKTAKWHWAMALECEGGRMPARTREQLQLGVSL